MDSLNLILVFILLFSSFSSSSDISQLFETWSKQHGKSYASDEEKLHRFKVFEDNYEFVRKHNELSNSSYSLSLNAFADLTHHEFKSSRLGFSAAYLNLELKNESISGFSDFVGDVPNSIDWRKEGAVTKVKDQGNCGMFDFIL